MGGIFWEKCFWMIFLGGFFWEDFFGGVFLGRNSLFALELIGLSRFRFLSRFCLNAEEGKFQSLEVREQAPSHLKIHRR